jgi:hypothetical protein
MPIKTRCSRIRSLPPCLSSHIHSNYILDKVNLKLRHYKVYTFFHRISLNICKTENFGTWVSSVGTVPGYWLYGRGLIRGKGKVIFSIPQCPGRLWDLPSFLSNGYRELFPKDKTAGVWSWPLISIWCEDRNEGAIPPLPHVFMA